MIVGQYANAPHRHRALIGYRNWINFEVAQSTAHFNKIVAVKLDRSEPANPEELMRTNASWALAFTEQAIIRSLSEA